MPTPRLGGLPLTQVALASLQVGASELLRDARASQEDIAARLGHCVEAQGSHAYFDPSHDSHMRAEAVVAVCLALVFVGVALGAWHQSARSRRTCDQLRRAAHSLPQIRGSCAHQRRRN